METEIGKKLFFTGAALAVVFAYFIFHAPSADAPEKKTARVDIAVPQFVFWNPENGKKAIGGDIQATSTPVVPAAGNLSVGDFNALPVAKLFPSLANVVDAVSRPTPRPTTALPRGAPPPLPKEAFTATLNSRDTPLVPASADPRSNINAKAALVYDVSDKSMVFELNADKRWPLASLTKLMAAVIVERDMDAEDLVIIREADLNLSRGTSVRFFAEGDRVKVKDLLRAMLVPSSNEAADLVAAHYGRDAFVKEMNIQAAAWGMNDTHYTEPTGLSALNQSTANDMRTLSLKVYESYPQLFKETREVRAVFSDVAERHKYDLAATNAFAGRADFIGGKTGYTDDAGGNLISLFQTSRGPVIIVIFGTNDRFNETLKLLKRYENN